MTPYPTMTTVWTESCASTGNAASYTGELGAMKLFNRKEKEGLGSVLSCNFSRTIHPHNSALL